ncbi:MAG: hypothetical protein M1826_002219 [Phylliscum demangeonii]|nr:MAG: hypothetical protein M1826_002219 [Phylliscum demangeonii]
MHRATKPSVSSATPQPSAAVDPRPTNSRFTSQTSTAEDLLKSQTVGLVHLSDFRKRRAEAVEQKEREAEHRSLGRFTPGSGQSGTSTPVNGESGSNGQGHPYKKKKKREVFRGKLSFGVDDGDDVDQETNEESGKTMPSRAGASVEPETKAGDEMGRRTSTSLTPPPERRLGPNTAVTIAPKVVTKSALLREAQTREQLRKEFLDLQRVVRATEALIPFVFYDGTNIPGGVCKVKKGDHAWLFLDKARKVGAELGVGGAGERASSKREWARVGVDDLIMVRGEIIIPHHYDFYYFIVNKTIGPSGAPLFNFSAQATENSPSPSELRLLAEDAIHSSATKGPSSSRRRDAGRPGPGDETLEGRTDDPIMTKVVDRRWYERNKHIFPASVWEEFDPEKDYSNAVRRDAGGNAFFFS